MIQTRGDAVGWVGVVEMMWGRNFSLFVFGKNVYYVHYCFANMKLNLKTLKYHLIPLLFSV